MAITTVKSPDGRNIKVNHPEGATQDQIISFAKNQNAPEAKAPEAEWYQGPRAALQGMTFGFSDELGSLTAAGMAKATGEKAPYWDIYNDMHQGLQGEREEYRKNHPVKAGLLEVGGGLATGGTVGKNLLQQGAKIPMWLKTMGVGGLEGGIYGLGSGDQGERMKTGAQYGATGMVAAPVGGYVLDKTAKGAGHALSWVAKKLSETPKAQAVRIIRKVAADGGYSPDELVARYEKLGPDGFLMDVDENFRGLTRAMSDELGPAKRVARDAIESRQAGTVDRVIGATKGAISGDDAQDTINTLTAQMKANSKPFYDSARQQPLELDDYTKIVIDKVPDVRRAFTKAQRIMAAKRATGEEITNIDIIDQFKKELYDIESAYARDGKGNAAGDLGKIRRKIIESVDNQIPDYKTARGMYAGKAKLLEAVDSGKGFFKMSSREFDDLVGDATDSELEMIRIGATRSILDKLENTQLTHDAAKKLVNTKGMQSKLLRIFKSEDDAASFIEQMAREAEFTRTRQVVGGGSPTSQNLAGQKGLGSAVNDMQTLIGAGDPLTTAVNVASKLVGRGGASPETIDELTKILINNAITPKEARKILTPMLGKGAERVVGNTPQVLRGAVTPGLLGATQ